MTRSRHLLILAVFAVLVAGAAAVAPRLFVLFDEAYNLNLSKTLMETRTYSTRTADGLLLFDPSVTTGPTLTVPMAVALRLGGATIPVVRATMLVIFVVCLMAVYLSARALLPGHLTALGFLILFYTTNLVLVFGLCMLGDIPAISLMLGGIALLKVAGRMHGQSLPMLGLSGVLFGLAALTKDIALLLMVAIVLVCGADAVMHTYRQMRSVIANLVPVGVALTIVLAWRGCQVVVVWSSNTAQDFRAWNRLATQAARGLWERVTFSPFSHVGSAWLDSLDYFGPILLSLLVGAVGFVALRRVWRLPVTLIDKNGFADRVIISGLVLWFTWYYVLSGPQAMNRHLLPAIVLGEMLVVKLVAELVRIARADRLTAICQIGVWVLTTGLVLVLLWTAAHGLRFTRFYLAVSEDRLASQQAAATWIRSNVPPDAVLSGWGWYVPWHIAFLADRVPSQVRVDTPNLWGLTDWFVLSPEVEWTGMMDDRLRDFLARQGPPVVGQRLYAVYRVTWRPPSQP